MYSIQHTGCWWWHLLQAVLKPCSWLLSSWRGLCFIFWSYLSVYKVSLDCVLALVSPLSYFFPILYWCLGQEQFQCCGWPFPMLFAWRWRKSSPCMQTWRYLGIWIYLTSLSPLWMWNSILCQHIRICLFLSFFPFQCLLYLYSWR